MKQIQKERLYDVIVIGGGPAGLTAAIYLARAKYRVLVVEKEKFGGQITITEEVVNYPGIAKTSGTELTNIMRHQAENFGAEFLLTEVESIDANGDVKIVHTSRGDFLCLGLLIATGAHPRTVGFKGEEEYKGRGVAYCATCDGEFFSDKEIFVIGGGYAAAEESVFLTKFARHVTILIREEDFTCAATVADKAKQHEKITIKTNIIVEEVSGENGLNYIRYKNTKTGEVVEYHAKEGDIFGVFVFAGYSPDTNFIKDVVKLNEYGYVITDSSQRTTVAGVYAAGDVCIKPLRQIVTATGDGALAATDLEKYVANMQQKTGLHPTVPVKKEITRDTVSNKNLNVSDELFSDEIKQQLKDLFYKMERKLTLKLYLDNRAISSELESFMVNLVSLSDKLSVMVAKRDETSEIAPCVKVFLEDGSDTGIAFHGVPGGHEFTSFVLGLYNAAGPGQTIDEDVYNEIKEITKPVDIKILVSLSCTMCPDVVIATQRIASENPNVRAEAYDIQHFPQLKEKYHAMSVPCMVINDTNVSFGKKNIRQILEIIR